MQPVAINAVTVRALAQERGIDTLTALAETSGVSRWALYKALERGRIQPSHAQAIARTLKTTVTMLSTGAD